MIIKAGVVCGAVVVSGCAGPRFEGSIFEQPQQKKDPEVARIATNTQQMSLEFLQLSEQVAAFSRTQELLDARLTRMEAQLSAAPRSQDDLTALRRDMQLLRTERESLRKEITDDLAGRIEKIAARQQADINAARTATATVAAAGAAGATRTSGGVAPSGRGGYEHKVERGQTLSEIARGYNKSVESIMKANKLSNPSSIRIGQLLFIPD